MSRWLAAACIAVTCSAAVAHTAGPRVPFGLDRYRPVPEENPLTRDKVSLGRRLFFDSRLSRDGTRSCGSCHVAARAFTDGRTVARGPSGLAGRRNVPTLVNRAWGRSFFWDGRVSTLEEQVLAPIFNPLELGASAEAVTALARSARYVRDFRRVFGPNPTPTELAQALAAYVRTIVSGESPLDYYLSGRSSALGPSAQRGMRLFNGRAGCSACHTGPLFTDESFHNTGIAWRRRSGSADGIEVNLPTDPGRASVTGLERDRGAFKTPTLRNVTETAPYMHDGSVATLADVVEFYNRGGQANPALDHRIRPLGLTAAERAHLVAFLGVLTGPVREGW
jgi:cytochrome c peroxidase